MGCSGSHSLQGWRPKKSTFCQQGKLRPLSELILLVQVLYPTNSKGEVCGKGAHEGKQYMMMFDITRHGSTWCSNLKTKKLQCHPQYSSWPNNETLSRCIGLSPAIEGCPTPSVCVEKCPDITWEWEEGKVKQVKISKNDKNENK